MSSDSFPGSATLPLSVGTGALYTLIHLEMWWGALVAFILTAGVTLLAVPRDAWIPGMDMRTTAETDFIRWDGIRLFLPGALAFVPGAWVAGPAWPLYFLGVTGAMLLSFRLANRRIAAVGHRRAQKALAATSLADATLPRLSTAAQHRAVMSALAKLGAVDGLRARMWRVSKEMGGDVGKLHAEVLALQRAGLVSVSTIDAGADTTRHLVELTPIGVRVYAELARR